ncbi:VOC family protein [Paenarthrobacter sp. NPDC057981]|uniref:VOC family protein n=1 Tax=Paenarthrobacter sp. NPDC057981 TaxID=3346297 RepID=UPI0036DD539C
MADIDRSLEFWQDAMGLSLVARQEVRGGYLERITGEPGAHTLQAHLRFPGTENFIELLQYLAPAGRQLQLRPRDSGGGHVAVTCHDLTGLLERLVKAGGVPFGEPVALDHGINRGGVALYLRDPDQHIVELVQPPASSVGEKSN